MVQCLVTGSLLQELEGFFQSVISSRLSDNPVIFLHRTTLQRLVPLRVFMRVSTGSVLFRSHGVVVHVSLLWLK